MRPTRLRHNRRGFTIIELLVVIAIIALLAAITFPVIASVMQAGKRTGCMENMRQIVQGIKLFKEDHGVYPDALYGYDDYSGPSPVQHRFLYPQYIKNRSDFNCPASVFHPPANEVDPTQQNPQPEGDDLCLTRAIAQNSATGQPAVTQNYYYPWDSYDVAVVANRREGLSCGNAGQPFLSDPNNSHFEELHYQKAWLFPLPPDPTKPPDPRQLLLRSPSEQTVVTWCMNHTKETPIDATQRSVTLEEGALALVAFLDGRVQTLPASRMVVWNNADGNTWRVTAKP
jgi:prepilin-type N-terminal cleavage/methylation domain-containing protein